MNKKFKEGGASEGTIYFLGFLGALIYYIQVASSAGDYIVGFIKAIIWPGILMYRVFVELGL